MDSLGLPEDQPIQNMIISRTIESAQSKIEGFNFDIRKHVLEYDDVMNKQREVVYKKRKEIFERQDLKNEIFGYVEEQLERIVSVHCVEDESQWNLKEIFSEVGIIFPLKDEDRKKIKIINDDKAKNTMEKISSIIEYLIGISKVHYNQKEAEIGAEAMRQVEKMIILQTIDTLWMNHLDEIDYLRQGIGLRGYGQRDPLVEYKREAFNLFSHLMENIRVTIVHTIFRISVSSAEKQEQKKPEIDWQFKGADDSLEQFGTDGEMQASGGSQSEAVKSQPLINANKIGRNDPCPCGSGKKYKKCCGK